MKILKHIGILLIGLVAIALAIVALFSIIYVITLLPEPTWFYYVGKVIEYIFYIVVVIGLGCIAYAAGEGVVDFLSDAWYHLWRKRRSR
jgi:hypothetical protein